MGPVKAWRVNSLRDIGAKWGRRSGTERVLLLEAFLLLAAARIFVKALPFRWLARSLGRQMQEGEAIPEPADLKLARMIGAAVVSASGYTPWESACLPQAAAAKWMLRRRRVPATVCLGVMKDSDRPQTLAAHAWVRCGGIVLTGAPVDSRYTVVSTFS